MVNNIYRLLRVKQWIKNLFLFFPLMFSGKFLDLQALFVVMEAFVAFSLVASGVYILNDIVDIKKDQHHPQKSRRPLASGQLSVLTAIIIMTIVLVVGLRISFMVNRDLGFLALAYILLQGLYNLRNKHVVLVDVLSVAFGFMIRIWAGAVAAMVMPSAWLQLCVFVLALFLGFAKRRSEMAILKTDAPGHRGVLSYYSMYLLDQLIMICATLAIVFYSLYTISPDVIARVNGYHMLYSVPFVIYGIFRFLFLVHVHKRGEDAGELVIRDLPLFIAVVGWVVFVGAIIYLSRMVS